MDAELYYEVHGGQGPYLVLVHGMLSSRAQWGLNLEALSRVARPVVVELFGHGRSPSPREPRSYHPDVYVAALERLRVRLGAERWALCGQSFGATLTIRYALRFPERVPAQVFTNSVSALSSPEDAARVAADVVKAADAIVGEGRPALERMPAHPRHAKRLPAEVHQELLRDAALLDPVAVAQSLRVAVPACSLHNQIAGNRVPTLLVCGEREKRFERLRRHAERTMPRLEVAGFPAGHAVNIEAARGFDAAVGRFLERYAREE